MSGAKSLFNVATINNVMVDYNVTIRLYISWYFRNEMSSEWHLKVHARSHFRITPPTLNLSDSGNKSNSEIKCIC